MGILGMYYSQKLIDIQLIYMHVPITNSFESLELSL